ncbi:hypothetical protein CkaCkLH20_11332 [Colletotrichum karsti]|uniref:Uncharacterized protein n=1 Tax=Colletotrichum karsti TaxID=1095194 RepID=A0A9P6HU26_9PEZI|nr:uncharacterized protein CkaCkLH20_11332 [Colletotrichum karsti]KAF9871163.1 hypothetical protein CkaCkLH20_11332 [Colletotrichum karsti]
MSDKLQHLVCLDVSGLPGSLQPLLAARRRHLAHLKILKARRREINDGLAIQLFQAFKSTLWSLDISENKVTDAVLDDLAALCFSSPSLRSHSRLMTEGKLTADGHGNDSHGRFMSIQESDWSGTFRHPERHLVDAPVYSVDPTRGLQEDEAVRSNGKGPLKRDTVDHIKAAVAGSMDRPVPDWSGVPHLDVCTAPAGITHLHLSDTHITSAGERDIKTGSASYQRGPTFLSGLRRIRLEFEADPGFSTSELDAEGLMDMGKDFSFFPQDNMSKVEDTARLAPAVQPPIANLPPVNRACDMYPFSDFDGEYMDYSGDTWAGRPFDRKVWIGPGLIKNVQHSKDSVTNNQATREYSKLATYPFLRARVGPASPDHIKAGVPSGSLLFHAAWDAIVMPSKEDLRPSAEGLRGMRDVLDAIKAYRLQTRTAQTAAVGDVDGDGQNFFWSGRLEVSIPFHAE